MASLAVSADGIPCGVGEDLFKSRRKIVQPQGVRGHLRRRGCLFVCVCDGVFACLASFIPARKRMCASVDTTKRGREAAPGGGELRGEFTRQPARASEPGEPAARARGGAARTERPDRPGRAPRARASPETREAAAASTASTAARKVGPASGTRPPHPRPTEPPTALHAIHLLPSSLFTSPSFSPAPHRHLHSSQPEPGPGPPPPQHTSLATIRPTCRRGHFSTGPRSSYLKRKCHFASLAPGFRLFYASPSQWGGLCIRLRP